jgi:hypothetical protein
VETEDPYGTLPSNPDPGPVGEVLEQDPTDAGGPPRDLRRFLGASGADLEDGLSRAGRSDAEEGGLLLDLDDQAIVPGVHSEPEVDDPGEPLGGERSAADREGQQQSTPDPNARHFPSPLRAPEGPAAGPSIGNWPFNL